MTLRALTFALLLAIARVATAGIALTDPVYGPVYGSFGAPVATNGSVFLALWNNLEPVQVRGVLADANGRVLTPIPFLVLPDAFANALASAGENFVVAWTAGTNSHVSLLDRNRRLVRHIATLPYFQGATKIAASGNRILVVTDTATLVDFDGSVIRSGIPITAASSAFDVISTSEGFSVGVAGAQSVTLIHLSRDGDVTNSESLPLAGDRFYGAVAIASSGAETLVVWVERSRAQVPPADRVAWTVFPGGVVHYYAPPPPSMMSVAEPFWTGTSYSLVAGPVLDIDRNGELLATRSAPIPFAGFSGANIGPLLFSTQFENPLTTAAAFRLDTGVAQQPSTPISISSDSQYRSDTASVGNVFASSWEADGAGSKIQAARFTAAGERLDPHGLDTAISTSSGGTTTIAGGDSMFVVAWFDSYHVVVRRLSSSGMYLDPEPVVVPGATSQPAIAWNGQQFLIVWTQADRLAGSLMNPDGTIEPARFLTPPSEPAQFARSPAVAWDGKRFLLVWTMLQNAICECPPEYIGIRAIRVSADGDMIDAQPAIVTESAAVAHVASGGSDFLIVADSIDKPFTTSAYLISGETAALYVPKAIDVAQWSSAIHSDVTWDGRDYVVALHYLLGGVFPTIFDPAWIATVRVSRSGFASNARVRASGPYSEISIAADAAGRTAVTVTEAAQELGGWRVRAYFDPDFEAAPAPPSDPANVTTGVDGDALVVSWTPTSPNQAGFVVDVCLEPGPSSFCIAATAPAEATSIRLSGYSRAQRVHVSAANAGGTASMPLIPRVPLRRRAISR